MTQPAETIDDYADTAGKRRKERDTAHGTQPGDPARAAQAIITVVNSPDAPELLLLGTDALAAMGSVLDGQRAEIDAWQELSASTDFEA